MPEEWKWNEETGNYLHYGDALDPSVVCQVCGAEDGVHHETGEGHHPKCPVYQAEQAERLYTELASDGTRVLLYIQSTLKNPPEFVQNFAQLLRQHPNWSEIEATVTYEPERPAPQARELPFSLRMIDDIRRRAAREHPTIARMARWLLDAHHRTEQTGILHTVWLNPIDGTMECIRPEQERPVSIERLTVEYVINQAEAAGINPVGRRRESGTVPFTLTPVLMERLQNIADMAAGVEGAGLIRSMASNLIRAQELYEETGIPHFVPFVPDTLSVYNPTGISNMLPDSLAVSPGDVFRRAMSAGIIPNTGVPYNRNFGEVEPNQYAFMQREMQAAAPEITLELASGPELDQFGLMRRLQRREGETDQDFRQRLMNMMTIGDAANPAALSTYTRPERQSRRGSGQFSIPVTILEDGTVIGPDGQVIDQGVPITYAPETAREIRGLITRWDIEDTLSGPVATIFFDEDPEEAADYENRLDAVRYTDGMQIRFSTPTENRGPATINGREVVRLHNENDYYDENYFAGHTHITPGGENLQYPIDREYTVQGTRYDHRQDYNRPPTHTDTTTDIKKGGSGLHPITPFDVLMAIIAAGLTVLITLYGLNN